MNFDDRPTTAQASAHHPRGRFTWIATYRNNLVGRRTALTKARLAAKNGRALMVRSAKQQPVNAWQMCP